MKKTISVMFVFLLLGSPMVLAQTIEQKAGVTPDSFMWRFELTMEKIWMGLISNQLEKINYGFDKANERLAEIQVMADQEKIQFIDMAEVERENIINQVELKSRLTEQNRELFQEKLQSHIRVLEQVREKVPEKAKMGIDSAIEKSSKSLENSIN